MKEYKYYISDLDGTLIDSAPANVDSYAKAFASVGMSFDSVKYLENFGLRFKEMMKIMAPDVDEATVKKIKQAKRKFYSESYDLIRLNEPLINLLYSVKHKATLAMATTADESNASPLLKHFNLDKMFSYILYGNDVTHGKPNPECYLRIISLMKANPQDCLIFEDSLQGFAAAQATGADLLKVKI